MDKVFLLRVCAYRKPMNTCNEHDYKSELFADLKSAVREGKKILKKQLNELWKTDEYRDCYKSLDEYCEKWDEGAGYIFWVEERYLKSLQTKTPPEEETDEEILKNPAYIEWRFDFHGNLESRWYYGISGNNFQWMPSDELPGAGTLFHGGDLVVDRSRKLKYRYDLQEGEAEFYPEVFVVGYCPDLREYRDNTYICYSIDGDQFGFATHEHLRECDLERYEGEISEPLKFLSDLFAGRIEVPEDIFQDIIDGKYSFSPKPTYKDIPIKR